jgi:hydroxymethylglutaryl-CoA lyase
MRKRVDIVEVGPRDGFQSVKEFIPTEKKLMIIDEIVKSGMDHIQATSFVNPKAIPQMADAREVAEACLAKYPEVSFSALVPNLRGAKAAIESGLGEISYVMSVSETHNLNNVRRTHEQSFGELAEIVELFPDKKINLDMATTFGCHYEGILTVEKIMDFLKKAYDIGIRSFNLCDTVGLAIPSRIREIVGTVLKEYGNCDFEIHIHDTRNMGILNSFLAIESGITKVQTALGGLGGCPFAPGASGNTSTEDLVYMLNEMGYDTGINTERIIAAAKVLKENVEGNYSGHQIFIDVDNVKCQQ